MNNYFFALLCSILDDTIAYFKNPNNPADATCEFQYLSENSVRVISSFEQAKLTKPALQYLLNSRDSGLISTEQFEHIMDFTVDSNIHILSTQDIKTLMREFMPEYLSTKNILKFELSYDLENTHLTMH